MRVPGTPATPQALTSLPDEDPPHHGLLGEPQRPRLGRQMKPVRCARLVRGEVFVAHRGRPCLEERRRVTINRAAACQRCGRAIQLGTDASQELGTRTPSNI